MENTSKVENDEFLTDLEIFTNIWIHPRKVYRYLENNSYDKYIILLCPIIGIIVTLGNAIDKNIGDKMELEQLLLINISIGIFIGWLKYFFYSVGISWTGPLIGGNANWRSIFRIMCYGFIPFSFSLIILFISIYVDGISLFQSSGTFYETPIGIGLFGIDLILAIWSTILVIIGISEIQKFPIWKAIINYLLPAVLLVGVLIFGFWIGKIL